LPPDFKFADLSKKLRERRKLEPGFADESPNVVLEVFYRDEVDGKLYRLGGDEDLAVARDRCEKLTLEVRSVG